MVDQSIKLTVGGDVQAANGIYLQRPEVDEQLFNACLANEFTYVLASPQTGKSSLKNAIAEQLIDEGVRVARIDLKRIAQVEEAKIWYFSLLNSLSNNLRLQTDVEAWWDSQPRLSTFTQRFLRFLDEVLLTEISEQVVIFIDEIDITLCLPFSDDFFAAIRAVHNDRAQYAAYKRLSFVLLGVAMPNELIKDNKRTPFNIGQGIPMRDFTKAECSLLGLAIEANHPGKSAIYFQQIYDWTSGHPYLTQKLCTAVTNAPQTNDPDLVDNLVQTIFLTDHSHHDDNIRVVQSRVLHAAHAPEMLRIYQKTLEGKVVYDDQSSIVINTLKLCGLVTSQKNKIKTRNKIYLNAFNKTWVNNELYKNCKTGHKNTMIFIMVLFIIVIISFNALNY